MTEHYQNARRAPTDLASGRVLAPGELVAASDLVLKDPDDAQAVTHDAALVDDGALTEANLTPDESLQGDDLQARARALGIPRRSTMGADELRVAVAEAEATAAGSNDQEETA